MTRNVLGIILPARGTCQITELGNLTDLEIIGIRKNLNRGDPALATVLVLPVGSPRLKRIAPSQGIRYLLGISVN
jgi:hypothetical protein